MTAKGDGTYEKGLSRGHRRREKRTYRDEFIVEEFLRKGRVD